MGTTKMYELFVEDHFSAAHHLRGYLGNCANLHGHNWQVKLLVQAKSVDQIGMAVDFRKLKSALGEIIGKLDHTQLNELPVFQTANPTCEALAKYLFHEASAILNDDNLRVTRIEVHETPKAGAAYFE
jgi:6-pyruvoyltetrahydropterin/6-carboxytetrahydropterin synthase